MCVCYQCSNFDNSLCWKKAHFHSCSVIKYFKIQNKYVCLSASFPLWSPIFIKIGQLRQNFSILLIYTSLLCTLKIVIMSYIYFLQGGIKILTCHHSQFLEKFRIRTKVIYFFKVREDYFLQTK